MLQVLKSVDDFERIVNISKLDKRELTLIGYLDKPYKTLQQGDLILYVGSVKNLAGLPKHLMYKLQLKLMSELLNTRICKDKMFVLNEILIETSQVLTLNYSYVILTVKLVEGLNDFGIAGYEIYQLILKATEYYLKLSGKEEDN